MHLTLRACAFALIALILIPAAHATDTNMGETSEILFCNGGTAPYTGCLAADLRTEADTLASPSAIFEYVRNNYDLTLYHGARSGSVNAFLGGRGNDVDLAATLIAMLRSQGVPAHYVVGTVCAPATQVMNWLQVEDPTLAKSLLVDQGIQGVVSSTSTCGTTSTPTLNFEHVWVEALVPYGQYRGEVNSTVNCAITPTPGVCHWVPMDPSWKQYVQINSGLDPYSTLSFDYTNYYNAIVNANTSGDTTRLNKNPLEIYQEQVLSWLSTYSPGKTLNDIPDFRGIVTQTNGLLPASLPYAVVSATRIYNSAEDHDAVVPATEPKKWMKYVTATAMIYYYGILAFTPSATVSLVDASTHRFTLSFLPVNSIYYQMFRLDATQVGGGVSGTGVSVGNPMPIVVSMDGSPDPTGGTNDQTISASYNGIVGGTYLIATGGETSNWSQVHRAAKQLLDANQQYKIVFNPADSGLPTNLPCNLTSGMNCNPYVDVNNNGWDSSDPLLLNDPAAMDAMTGGLLYVASTQYFAQLKDNLTVADKLNRIKTPITGFLGVVSSTYEAEYIADTAFSVLPGGLLIDMKGIHLGGSWRIDQPATYSNNQFTFIGHIMSSLEHETWQSLTGYDAISTVRGIQMALANGGTLLDLTAGTVQSMYAPMGFGSAAPSGFTLDRRPIYGTLMDSWWYATADGTQEFTILEKQPTSSTDSRRAGMTYHNDAFDGVYQSPSSGSYYALSLDCFYTNQNHLQSLENTYGASALMSAGSLCISSFPVNTTIASAIALNQSDYATYRIGVGTVFFDNLDENKGFNTANFLFRSVNNAASNAQPAASVMGWRDTLYFQNLTLGWNEIQVPSILSTGSNFRFSVDIHKTYDTSNYVTSATFEIQNMQGVAAGGGFVGLPGRNRADDATGSSLAISGKSK